jgi:DNA-binding MarR family transcriptional regulator
MEKTISPMELSTLLSKSKDSCINLSLAEFRVLTYLLACANIKDGEGYKCWPSTETISEHTGIHIKTIEKVRKSLVDNGWMQYKPGKGKGNCNTYYINGFKIVECFMQSGNPRPKGAIAASVKIELKEPRERNTNGLKRGKTTPKPSEQKTSPAPDYVPKKPERRIDPGFPRWYYGTQVFNEDELRQATLDKELVDAGLESPF